MVVGCAPGLHLISTLFQEKDVKHPWRKRQDKCSESSASAAEPYDTAFRVLWLQVVFKRLHSVESFSLAAKKVVQGLVGLVRKTVRLG